jgi:hypothetical protein
VWVFRGLVFAVAAAAAGCVHSHAPLAFPEMRNVANVFAGVNATLLGFLVSAGALLYAVANTSLARNLQRTGHFGRLLGDLFTAAGVFLLALVWSLVGLFVPEKVDGFADGAVMWHVLAGMVFFNSGAFALLLPLGYKFWHLLVGLQPDDRALE